MNEQEREYHGESLRATAGIKSVADSQLLHRVETAKKVYWAVSTTVALIALVVIWVVTIRRDVDYHERVLHKLWEQTFGTPLP